MTAVSKQKKMEVMSFSLCLMLILQLNFKVKWSLFSYKNCWMEYLCWTRIHKSILVDVTFLSSMS